MSDPKPSYNPNPRKPKAKLPAGACDTHFHVFGPRERFPYAAERSYTPPADAPKETLFALHKHLGIERGVVVQSAVHHFDNSAAADLLAANRNYRGIALLPASTPLAELKKLDAQGFRGVRFHYMGHLGKGDSVEAALEMAKRLAEIGWHLQIHMDGPRIGELSASLSRSPVPVVVDHMGRVDASRGIDSREFTALLALMKHKHVWVKVSGPERISKQHAPWKDARPFQRKLIAEFGDRAVWGTDWPHPNLNEVPDDGDLTDALLEAAPTEAERKAVLADNPKRLYGF